MCSNPYPLVKCLNSKDKLRIVIGNHILWHPMFFKNAITMTIELVLFIFLTTDYLVNISRKRGVEDNLRLMYTEVVAVNHVAAHHVQGLLYNL